MEFPREPKKKKVKLPKNSVDVLDERLRAYTDALFTLSQAYYDFSSMAKNSNAQVQSILEIKPEILPPELLESGEKWLKKFICDQAQELEYKLTESNLAEKVLEFKLLHMALDLHGMKKQAGDDFSSALNKAYSLQADNGVEALSQTKSRVEFLLKYWINLPNNQKDSIAREKANDSIKYLERQISKAKTNLAESGSTQIDRSSNYEDNRRRGRVGKSAKIPSSNSPSSSSMSPHFTNSSSSYLRFMTGDLKRSDSEKPQLPLNNPTSFGINNSFDLTSNTLLENKYEQNDEDDGYDADDEEADLEKSVIELSLGLDPSNEKEQSVTASASGSFIAVNFEQTASSMVTVNASTRSRSNATPAGSTFRFVGGNFPRNSKTNENARSDADLDNLSP